MIKIVTDSSADLPAPIVEKLGISVVPLYARFGDEIYKERVDITDEEFYEKLLSGDVHPVTIQPSPQDFFEVYQKLSDEADGIISVHLSSKLSGTYNSAVQARSMIGDKCPIEVIDSKTLTLAMGMMVIAAAEGVNAGKGMEEVVAGVNEAIPKSHALCLLDTLKYLLLGGRIGKAKALLGSVLNVKPLIAIRDGEVAPVGQARSRGKGLEQLFEFVKSATKIEELGIAYTTTPEDAQKLAERMATVFGGAEVRLARLGTTLGVHTGPGTIIVSLRGELPGAG